jgi:prepilin-type N-terminal cleavage/methylation domain-containing protein
MMRDTKTKSSGFTLIEVTVALALFVAGMVGLPALMMNNMRRNNEAKDLTTAVALANDKLEELKDYDYDKVKDGPTAGEDIDETGWDKGAAGKRIYNRKWTVTNNSPVTGTKTVAITVAWADYRPHTITLNNIVTQVLNGRSDPDNNGNGNGNNTNTDSTAAPTCTTTKTTTGKGKSKVTTTTTTCTDSSGNSTTSDGSTASGGGTKKSKNDRGGKGKA